jgi:cell shape-determining protein MreC
VKDKDLEGQIQRNRELIEQQLEDMAASIEALHDVLEKAKAHVEKQRNDRETALREQWRLQKEASAMRHLQEEYDALFEENERFRGDRHRLREGLRRVLTYARSLAHEYRP